MLLPHLRGFHCIRCSGCSVELCACTRVHKFFNLQCLGIDTGNRWNKVRESLMLYFDKRVLQWYDAHLMMSLVHGPADNESAARFVLAKQLIKVRSNIFVQLMYRNESLHCLLS